MISAKDQAILVMRGNNSGRNKRNKPKIDVNDNTPLPKRPKPEKKKLEHDHGLFGDLSK